MADISKEDLKKEITAILKDADLSSTSAKKVRQELEEKLGEDLSERKKEIDDIVMQCVKAAQSKKGKGKKNGAADDEDDDDDDAAEEDEEEEEDASDASEEEEKRTPKRSAKKPAAKRKKGSSDESDDASEGKESDEEYSPNKKAKTKKNKVGAKGRKKKGGSDSDSDDDWNKKKSSGAKKSGAGTGRRGGYNKQCTLTPELAAVVGAEQMARHEVVKKVWGVIKEKKLYDPKNKQFAICNDELFKVIGVKRFRTFGMMKFLKKHFLD